MPGILSMFKLISFLLMTIIYTVRKLDSNLKQNEDRKEEATIVWRMKVTDSWSQVFIQVIILCGQPSQCTCLGLQHLRSCD